MKFNRRFLTVAMALLLSNTAGQLGQAQSQGANALQGAWISDLKSQNAPPGIAIWIKPVYDFQTGALQDTVKIRTRIKMKSADEYESLDTSDFFLPNGALAVSWTAVQTAKRIKMEPVN